MPDQFSLYSPGSFDFYAIWLLLHFFSIVYEKYVFLPYADILRISRQCWIQTWVSPQRILAQNL